MDGVEHRAAVHAALGDPVRLAIIDRLTPGDAAPGELGEWFALASNLLAHHLRVLEDAGLIRRVRSEGDRRRSYVQLCLDKPFVRAILRADQPGQLLDGARVPRVVFVCTANSARSQLAAAGWNNVSVIPATSAGTHPAARVHPRAITVARRHGLRLDRAITAQFGMVHKPDDLVIAVCDNAHEELDPATTRLHWAIPDPVGIDTDEAFESAYDHLTRRVAHLANTIARH